MVSSNAHDQVSMRAIRMSRDTSHTAQLKISKARRSAKKADNVRRKRGRETRTVNFRSLYCGNRTLGAPFGLGQPKKSESISFRHQSYTADCTEARLHFILKSKYGPC